MGLETNFNGVDDLNQSWPTNAADPVSEGANHLRGIKKSLQGGFGGNGTYADQKFTGAVVTRTVAAGMSWLLSSIERGRITVTSLSEMFIEASSASGVLGLRAKDSGGITRPIWVLTALAAGSQLYHAAAAVLSTRTNGVAVRSGAGADPVLGFETAAAVDRGSVTGAAAGITIAALTGTAVNLGPAGATPVAVGVATMSAGTRTITNVVAPVNVTDAATKGYADGLNAGIKRIAAGVLTAPSTITKQVGCTVADGGLGLWTITLATPLSSINSGVVNMCLFGSSVTAVGICQYTITSTTSIQLQTYQGGSTNSLTDKNVTFEVLDLGP
jgi:hypothetical protein